MTVLEGQLFALNGLQKGPVSRAVPVGPLAFYAHVYAMALDTELHM